MHIIDSEAFISIKHKRHNACLARKNVNFMHLKLRIFFLSITHRLHDKNAI